MHLRWLLAAALLCVALAIGCELGTAALSEARRRAPDVASRAAFLEHESALLQQYPFLAEVFRQSQDIVAVGAWLPAIQAAWDGSSIVATAQRLTNWLANNLLARLLSPETFGEKAMVIAFFIVIVYAAAAIYMHNQRTALFERRFGGRASSASKLSSAALADALDAIEQ